RRLVVTADDFGAAPEVNAAVVRAHRDGILTSTSLMVTGDAVEEAVQLARETPSLAVGLHLVLAQGRPAAPPAEIPDLVAADGAFRRAPIDTGIRYAWQYLLGTGRAQLRREIEAQLAAFAARVYGMHQTGHVDERYLLALLAALPPGVSELYCHPSEGVAPAMAPYQQGYDHAGELAALTSARVREAVRAGGVELVSYAELAR